MTDNDTVLEIIERLIAADSNYHNGLESGMTDSEYDRLKRAAFAEMPEHEYFTKVGADVRGGKIKLPYVMGSLDQKHDQTEVQQWLTKNNSRNNKVLVSHKLDGVSVLLVYRNREFTIAYSRGNGIEGADISRHVKHMGGFVESYQKINPITNLETPEYLVVRAELIMRKDTFAEKYADKYANPRNMVAGCVNRKETPKDVLADIDIVCYQVVDSSDKNFNLDFEIALRNIGVLGMNVVQRDVWTGWTLTSQLDEVLIKCKEKSAYELDGIVLTLLSQPEEMRVKDSSSLNPTHSVKYKILDTNSIVETTVFDVEWEVSKSGYLKPTVKVAPVTLFGTVVNYATGFNAKFIMDNGIGPGAKVKITKAGAVIPHILGVTHSVDPALPNEIEFGKWQMNATGVDAILENHESNSKVIFKRALDFFDTLEVEQLKEASLLNIVKYIGKFNHEPTFEDIVFNVMDMSEHELVSIVGKNGEKIYASLRRRCENMKLETFLGACPHFGIGFGVRKAKKLLEAFPRDFKIEQLSTLNIQQIVEIEGFDQITASNVINGIAPALKFYDKVSDFITFKIDTVTTEMSGVVVVMTGFRDASLQEKIELMGGKVGSGVSSKTTHLLAIDPNGKSGKLDKARQLGVKVLSPDQFKDEFNL